MVFVKHNRRLLLCCLFFLAACNNEPAQQLKTTAVTEEQRINNAFTKIDSCKQLIKSGDLIVRTGNDFTSESLRSLNRRDKTYSHCGIASVENDTIFVYHALGGEWNPNQRLRKDKWPVFNEPYSNRGFAIYRYPLNNSDTVQLLLTVKKLYTMGIMFDMKFDLESNDRMYCAEFVYKAFIMGTKGKLAFNTSKIDTFNFVGVDDLFLQPQCRLQKKVLY